MSTQIATTHVIEPTEPPLKRRKLASTTKSLSGVSSMLKDEDLLFLNKPHDPCALLPNKSMLVNSKLHSSSSTLNTTKYTNKHHHRPISVQPQSIQWPSYSPSPSPPSILTFIDIEIMRTHFDNDSHHTNSDNDNNHTNSDNDSEISLILSTAAVSAPNSTTNGYLSPSASPPWGRSPSPPPKKYFHKPTKKRSRWDDKNEATSNANKEADNKYSTLVNLGVTSLIHSINMQQKKQQKVEPLLLDEHGNPLTDYHDYDEDDDLHPLMDIMDEEDIDDLDTDSDEFYDSDIADKPATRTRRSKAFKFIEQGTYTEKANTLRAKELAHFKHGKNKPRRLDIEMVAKKLHDDEGLEWLDRVPLVEWWDSPVLSDKNDYNSTYKKEMITDLIENPRILRPELLRDGAATNTMNGNGANHQNNNGIPWILTKKERKKMRRMKKKEEHQNRTDEIRLGLREAPEPRLKLSNIFRVLGAAAIRDPTAAESIARAQIWKRRVKHELHNATNMLNPQQRREKKRRKLQEDTSKEVHVSIFVIYDLVNKLNKTKICMNAQQLNLTGSVIMLNTNEHEENKEQIKEEDENELKLNMVIVEGGPKGINKYQHLLRNRIKWNEDINQEPTQKKIKKENKHADLKKKNCQKIWEGTVAKRAFQTFHQKTIQNESELKKFLKMHNVLSYWDMVKNSPVVTCI